MTINTTMDLKRYKMAENNTQKNEINELESLEGISDDDDISCDGNDKLEVSTELSRYFYGEIKYIKNGTAKILFIPTQKFVADKYKMIHSGIIDSVGHFCALAAVNQTNAIVSQTNSEFLSPIKENMALEFEASANYNSTSSKSVKVMGKHRGIVCYESTITILILPEHPFENTIIGTDNT